MQVSNRTWRQKTRGLFSLNYAQAFSASSYSRPIMANYYVFQSCKIGWMPRVGRIGRSGPPFGGSNDAIRTANSIPSAALYDPEGYMPLKSPQIPQSSIICVPGTTIRGKVRATTPSANRVCESAIERHISGELSRRLAPRRDHYFRVRVFANVILDWCWWWDF